jgi:hypothetical protein
MIGIMNILTVLAGPVDLIFKVNLLSKSSLMMSKNCSRKNRYKNLNEEKNSGHHKTQEKILLPAGALSKSLNTGKDILLWRLNIQIYYIIIINCYPQ